MGVSPNHRKKKNTILVLTPMVLGISHFKKHGVVFCFGMFWRDKMDMDKDDMSLQIKMDKGYGRIGNYLSDCPLDEWNTGNEIR